jgi:transcription termination/antitermination protein NusG
MRIGKLMSVHESNLLPLPTPSEKLPILPWYVIHTCSRHGVKVESGLTRKGLEVFLPKVAVRCRRRDRLQMLEALLFPGYLFVRTDLSEWAHDNIIRTLGVVRILGIKGQCAPVPEDTVTILRTLVNSGQPIFPGAKTTPGRYVRVIEGPLMGESGVIRKIKQGKRRLLGCSRTLGTVGMRRII